MWNPLDLVGYLQVRLFDGLTYLLDRFFASARFHPYENLCLGGWKSVLSPEAVAILDHHLRFPSRRLLGHRGRPGSGRYRLTH